MAPNFNLSASSTHIKRQLQQKVFQTEAPEKGICNGIYNPLYIVYSAPFEANGSNQPRGEEGVTC